MEENKPKRKATKTSLRNVPRLHAVRRAERKMRRRRPASPAAGWRGSPERKAAPAGMRRTQRPARGMPAVRRGRTVRRHPARRAAAARRSLPAIMKCSRRSRCTSARWGASAKWERYHAV